ncbi:hypothetical protein CC78DRAFT_528502 [Lojkania enalia]|uniref:S-adenosylmethionine-dependent methyltransferase n=1 Tax=Lojkania enalia TaxID=147567 RepID=A0A9P4NBB4_9PLEO|nr:hypothetical protein CC78DRAFT_528502 [Didymosphaeria enalia]
MSLASPCLPPSQSLPPVRTLLTTPEDAILSALRNLQSLYCPLRLPLAVSPKSYVPESLQLLSPPSLDSGYASRDEQDSSITTEEAISALRADAFERNVAQRWLTSLLGRADAIAFSSDAIRERVLDSVAFILSSFSDPPSSPTDSSLTRTFSFPAPCLDQEICIQLNDAPLSGTDHTDVGLQSWGASIILSGLICAAPSRFRLVRLAESAHVMELGAGTGLVSLVLGKLLPHLSAASVRVTATDYHPAVLSNLEHNIATNFSEYDRPVNAMQLDWSKPLTMGMKASVLFAADVVYAREHAVWLRDCAAALLAPDGVFWLVATVRLVGKFEGIAETVEDAFGVGGQAGVFEMGEAANMFGEHGEGDLSRECGKADAFGKPTTPVDEIHLQKDGRHFRILHKETLPKKRGVGRGDESGYLLFKIGWGKELISP